VISVYFQVLLLLIYNLAHRAITERMSVEHPSVAKTTETVADVTGTAANHVSPSSSARAIEFYFQCAVVVIGLVGTIANAVILYAMVASKQHKKQLLIVHQNVIDLIGCILLIITYALKLCNIYLTGLGGYWFCQLIMSENFIWCGILTSKANLIFITVDRYLKIVYPVWSKKVLRKWVVYSAMTFAWISGVGHNFALTIPTTAVVDGVCYSYVFWESRESQMGYAIFYFFCFYVFLLIIFIVCYWRILIAIRRQASVMAGYAAGTNTAQTQSHKIQSNVIKTMIFVSAFFAISDLPMQVYYLLLNIHANLTLLDSGYYAALFMTFFYFCSNPFIYAAKFEPVKQVLLRLIPCKKNAVQPVESVEAAPSRTPQTGN